MTLKALATIKLVTRHSILEHRMSVVVAHLGNAMKERLGIKITRPTLLTEPSPVNSTDYKLSCLNP